MDETYLRIHAQFIDGESPASLAKRYGVKAEVIHRILRVAARHLESLRPVSLPASTVFEAIDKYGDDERFEVVAEAPRDFRPTTAMPGTNAKLSTLAARAAAGLPLWHDDDRLCFSDDES